MAVSNYNRNNESCSKTSRSGLFLVEPFVFSDTLNVHAYKRFGVEENPTKRYKVDEMDRQWLQIINKMIKKKAIERELPMRLFEYLMDSFEKEAIFSRLSSTSGKENILLDDLEEICSVCRKKQEDEADIIKCNMCSVKVHKTCYGVMYPPKSRWFCRKCWYSPSTAVQCIFCPLKNGALVPTENNKWSHIMCAFMFPYCYFENSILLETVKFVDQNSIEKQGKLRCYICKYDGKARGICLQCDAVLVNEVKCVKAYHVSCAQIACLKFITSTSDGKLKKFTYCHIHSSNAEKKSVGDESKILDKARLILRSKRNENPITSSPVIPGYSLHAEIIDKFFKPPVYPILKYSEAFKRTYAYWNLKRENGNGVPLLQELQSSSYRIMECKNKAAEEESEVYKVELESYRRLYYWKYYIEQNLKKVKKLCNLVTTKEERKHNLIRRYGGLIKSLVEVEHNKETVLIAHGQIKFVESCLNEILEQTVNINILSPIPDIIDRDTYSSPSSLQGSEQNDNGKINERRRRLQLPAAAAAAAAAAVAALSQSKNNETPNIKNNNRTYEKGREKYKRKSPNKWSEKIILQQKRRKKLKITVKKKKDAGDTRP